jgi:hypothetical protein
MKKAIVLSIAVVIFSASYVSADLAGNALVFDGLDDFVRIPDAPHLGGMSGLTVEAWFMSKDTSRWNPIVTKSDGIAVMTDRSYELALASSTSGSSWATFTGSSGWTWLYGSTPPVSVNQWTHIAATYDSTEGSARLYFNGNLTLSTTTDAGGFPISGLIRDSREDLILGAILANAYRGATFSFGMMDEVRMWNYARSESQIGQNFNKLLNPTENGLIGYWNFDENSGTQVIDSSSFHDNGIISGAIRTTSTAPIVPEPCTLLLLGVGGLLIRKRK